MAGFTKQTSRTKSKLAARKVSKARSRKSTDSPRLKAAKLRALAQRKAVLKKAQRS